VVAGKLFTISSSDCSHYLNIINRSAQTQQGDNSRARNSGVCTQIFVILSQSFNFVDLY
jgi:hypothetical protein